MVGGLYAGSALTGDSGVVVAMLEAGTVERVRAFTLGRHVCKPFHVLNWVGFA
jgi:hypothetical protein